MRLGMTAGVGVIHVLLASAASSQPGTPVAPPTAAQEQVRGATRQLRSVNAELLQRYPCFNGVKDGHETDVDCGGAGACWCPSGTPWRACYFKGVQQCVDRACAPCEDGKLCNRGGDCESHVCRPASLVACILARDCHGTCAPASCDDYVQNGGETDLNCGGVCPSRCEPGQGCATGGDCTSGVCTGQVCQNPPIGGVTPVESCQTRGQCTLFVTSTTYTGDLVETVHVVTGNQSFDIRFLDGLFGADRICNARASAAGLVGSYQAWLCDGVTAPADRSVRATVPYVRTDGALIAFNWTDLTDGEIANPINRDEFGTEVSWLVDSLPWTYVKPDGSCDDATYLSPGSGPCPAFSHCKLNCAEGGGNDGWTSSSLWAQGAKGDVNLTNTFWTDGVTGLCSSPNERLYCIEQ